MSLLPLCPPSHLCALRLGLLWSWPWPTGWAHILWLSEVICILFAASAFLRFFCQCFHSKRINIESLTPLLRGCCPWQHGANFPPPPIVFTSWKDPQAPSPDNNPSCQTLCFENLALYKPEHCPSFALNYIGWLLVPRAYQSHSIGIIILRLSL